jgi:hypothetical protein
LVRIAEVVLNTDEDSILGTKINKAIKEQISVYLSVINKEKSAVRATGVAPKQTWTYTLCNLINIAIEDDDEYLEEDDDE